MRFLREHNGVRVEWPLFAVAVGVRQSDLGRVVRQLLDEGQVLEVNRLTYETIQQDSGTPVDN